jgi:hypothetical protein
MDNDGLTLGGFLRSGRQRAGMTLERISAETKIPLQHLRALEAENLKVVPGGLYQRAEVRAYARLVGLDQNAALAHLERLLQPSHIAAERPKAEPRSPVVIPTNVARWLTVAGVAAFAVVFGLVASQQEPSVREDPIPASATSAPPLNGSGAREQLAAPRVPVVPADPVAEAQEPESFLVETTGDTEDRAAGVPQRRETELLILSEPSGGRVTVDGVGWGATPVTVRNLPPGPKRIRVTMAGYVSAERVTQLNDERPARIQISLQPAPD